MIKVCSGVIRSFSGLLRSGKGNFKKFEKFKANHIILKQKSGEKKVQGTIE